MSFVAAVDWGTSRFRLWIMDEAGGVQAERRSDEGLARAGEGGFERVLEGHLESLGAPAPLPVVICGMAGSRQGWTEARYIDLPARLADLASSAVPVAGVGRDIRILPGLAQRSANRPDVMRGEETQLLGVSRQGTETGLVCLPGTHSKWAELSGGVVSSFSTYLTGELFALLSEQSILRHAISDASADRGGDPAYAAAIADALDHPEQMTQGLFAIRAAQLLDDTPPAEAAARLSGLVIGAEIAGAVDRYGAERPVTLVAGGRLLDLYRPALLQAGFTVVVTDADEAVRTGLFAAAAQLWPIGEERRRA